MIDDGRWRALAPLCIDFVRAPDGSSSTSAVGWSVRNLPEEAGIEGGRSETIRLI